MIDLETRIELLQAGFAAMEARLQEIEDDIERLLDVISND